MEARGHVVPCFRIGTDYILNLADFFTVPSPLASYAEHNLWLDRRVRIPHPSTAFSNSLGFSRQPMSRYTAVGLLHIPLGITLFRTLSGVHKRRLHRLSQVFTYVSPHKATRYPKFGFSNRTPVRRPRHTSFSGCSPLYLKFRLTPAEGQAGDQLVCWVSPGIHRPICPDYPAWMTSRPLHRR